MAANSPLSSSSVFLFFCLLTFISSAELDNQCDLSSINAQEPSYSLHAEGGVSDFWDYKSRDFVCAGLSLHRHRFKPRALMLPLYHNAPVLVYIVQGRAMCGMLISDCPETFESSQQTKRFRDRHQKIQFYRPGDVVAIPAGVAHWCYNTGDDELLVVVMQDTAIGANQLDRSPTSFYLAGIPQQQEEYGGRREWGNIFHGFDVEMLTEAFRVDNETADKLRGEFDQRGHFVLVDKSLQVIAPPIAKEYGSEDNGLEETVCTARLNTQIDVNPSRADFYNPRAGRFTAANGWKLPVLRFLQLSAATGVLYKHAIMAPHWRSNAHSVIYVARGEARMQIVNDRGEAVFDSEVREGQAVVVPQNFAAAKQAGVRGCEWVAFSTDDNAMMNTLGGRTSAVSGLPVDVIAAAYEISSEEAARLKFSRRETLLFAGDNGRVGAT